MITPEMTGADRERTLEYLDEVVSLALRAETMFKHLPDIVRSDSESLRGAKRLEAGIAACRDLVARMGCIADIAAERLGAGRVAGDRDWLLSTTLIGTQPKSSEMGGATH
jgi:hypothetical protein